MGKTGRLLLTIFLAIAVRLFVATGPFSGQGDATRGGDFEAQRHWMEIAVNTPVNEWYTQTESNDLSWWGLDYPPLSGYWAWATGKVAERINPDWVALGKSRRCEDLGLKWYMRLTVILADLAIMIPAFLLFAHNRSYTPVMRDWVLCNPALLLIDHGHFQYNTVMLGLLVLAVVMLLDYKRPLVTTLLVSCSVFFKQMGLYAVPPFAFFLLKRCLRERSMFLFVQLALISIAVTILVFAPFLECLEDVAQRMFPLQRGLFEDKVANFWWAASVLTKFNRSLSQSQLVRLCSITLLSAMSPSLLSLLFTRPSGNKFLYSLAYCSLCFFMFSYHVHEKGILVPQMAVLLLTHISPKFVFWFSCLSALSLFQLMEKDGLQAYYFVVVTGWLLSSQALYRFLRFSWKWALVIVPTLAAMYVLPLGQLYAVGLYPRYPHLYHVLGMLGCSAGFSMCLVYLLYKQFTCEGHHYYGTGRSSVLSTASK